MVIYVSHAYGGNPNNVKKAKEITHDLQINDLSNCYICPLNAFSHLGYSEIGYEEEMLLCEDLLTVCDKLIVASEISKGVEREIALAELLGMEVEYLETE
jgi:hypothetical protein